MLGYQFCPRIADLTDQRLWRIDPHAHYGPRDPVALADYGRIARTLHLLPVLDPDDDSYRRAVNTQLTVQESRHRLTRKLFFGQRGELRQRYREGQEDQLSALGLVLNAVVLWNTRYTDAAVHQQRTQGYPVADEHATRLSPLGDQHLNVHGRYAFTPLGLPTGGLRPLRDPAAAVDEDDGYR